MYELQAVGNLNTLKLQLRNTPKLQAKLYAKATGENE